eukprot:CAMPEP_0171213334 /NCGR_PEP_ID=MMETSP0790-20130122/30590_1 /TAXON_ID=2925 /ORGANISM="Alexandrium catenella, Strain OF101" /LENGTH=327 /DNA_ID=CAMNT_0011679037 /DNA_START=61 /DNA_END=1043 /DNA_ORIENTATION=-
MLSMSAAWTQSGSVMCAFHERHLDAKQRRHACFPGAPRGACLPRAPAGCEVEAPRALSKSAASMQAEASQCTPGVQLGGGHECRSKFCKPWVRCCRAAQHLQGACRPSSALAECALLLQDPLKHLREPHGQADAGRERVDVVPEAPGNVEDLERPQQARAGLQLAPQRLLQVQRPSPLPRIALGAHEVLDVLLGLVRKDRPVLRAVELDVQDVEGVLEALVELSEALALAAAPLQALGGHGQGPLEEDAVDDVLPGHLASAADERLPSPLGAVTLVVGEARAVDERALWCHEAPRADDSFSASGVSTVGPCGCQSTLALACAEEVER